MSDTPLRAARALATLALFSLALAACGGGGSDQTPASDAPGLVAVAGERQSVSPGDYVLLDGSASRGPGEAMITGWEWTQTGGPEVKLINAGQPRAAFVAPAMEEEGELVFRLRVTDENDGTATDTTTIQVAAGKMPAAQPQVFHVCGETDEAFRTEALTALFKAREGDSIEFCAGEFNLTTGLILNSRRGITLRGQGMDETILNFRGSEAGEGLNISNSDGIVMEGFTIEDTPGNGIRVIRSRYVTFRDVRTRWRDAEGRDETEEGYTPRETNGAYGLYPVESEHVLIEDSEAHGASDAGIYVGQSNDVIVRDTLATYNVAGFEFENTYRGVYENNVARDNVGGFLVFDLPGLRQYGQKTLIRNNESYRNNTENFAPIGNIVGLVPRGMGMLLLSTDRVEIHDNEVYNNDTAGIGLVNFGLVDPNESDMKFDFYPQGIYIHDNLFRDNGGNPQEPDPNRGEASLLPFLLTARNLTSPPEVGTSAHIVWDGAVDTPDKDCPMPVDADGIPLDQPNPNEPPRLEPRLDDRGRPNFRKSDPQPECRYNLWKFNDEGELKAANGLYIQNNTYENTRLETQGVSSFLNANATSSDPQVLAQDLLTKQASNDLAPHRGQLPALQVPELDLPYVPELDSRAARPNPALQKAVCQGGPADAINWEALARFNCPTLQQYNLFEDPAEPRDNARGRSMKYSLTNRLFSDYALKDRFIFLPPDAPPAQYADHTATAEKNHGPTATLDFPVGTVIAKTFSFHDDSKEGEQDRLVETRLLIKRETARGETTWVGLPYVWNPETGEAELRVEGANVAASFDYDDPNPQVDMHYSGSVEHYQVPAAMNCMTCHGGDNRESGAAPIGPKARLMNREFDYGGEVGKRYQLEYMQELGMLAGLPEPGQVADPLPTWNAPGSSGEMADNDVHLRARAYLETNCMHCHNPGGAASNSNLELDSFRAVDRRYGICKRPVAAGRGSRDRRWVLVPGESAESILHYRVASTEPGVMMPPIGRTLGHTEALELLTAWLDESLEAQTHEEVHNDENCGGVTGELPEETDPLLLLLEQLGLLGLVDELEESDPGLLEALDSSI